MALFEFRRRIACGVAIALLITPFAMQANETSFPERPIRFVVPFPPGGGTDILARAMSASMSAELGQPFVVDNRPGASTTLGAEMVAKSPADGYTLLMGTGSTYVINSLIYPSIPYDPVGDFQPLAVVSRMQMLLVANPSVPVNTTAELVELAKAKPGALSYASPGVGTPHHLAMELFKDRAQVDVTHVPYKGAAQTLQDLLGERIDVMFLDYATAQPLIESQRIKVLGVASPERLEALSDVPTLAEAGLSDFEVSGWFGMAGPAGLTPAVRQKLEAAVAKAMADPAVLQQLVGAGYTPAHVGGDDMVELIAAEGKKWGEIIRSRNISTH